MSLSSQLRTKKVRAARHRKRVQNDGWRWLWRAIQVWLWQERNLPRESRHSLLTPEQQKICRRAYNQKFYRKNRKRLLLNVRLTRRMCPEIRDKWEAARRQKRKEGRA